ncbi:cytochrome ubiquinol oxidase subunit I [Pyruvatibacter mobilis]|uniref:Cytochrome ubiquinol oxidase subunit I n=1 Tax=Pyruvatibacter mobilis TaxID=1712261 RepID=A0A845QDJ4_9HYPH|nr:cytochrome ubiquinol oxidase subunit I [Pyruvatibacter mobilis]NBG96378.1 cytochrome ubiquinol oxidase subunit I [Pyruvatibacter mobilis]QJD75862.1 cytochrome ubiquinol oxidase subunit I [Pyruvatibacter mobilis]GGD19198.1 cytochrome ubiquinol oxidase subunit I [Pyruvatibacter mobilis]
MPEFLDALTLARAQFAFTVSFHIIFPAFSIGLASYLLVLEALWLRTGDDSYLRLFKYWMKIFAVAFGMGVVSGIVMSYQFGTNWSVFSDKAGPVIGPLMAYEVLTAFFLEAGFLGVMLFGMGRVSKSLHLVATAMVAFGTLLSATWILSVNSWMQTPTGYAINEVGQFVPVDWLAIVFNPSFLYRLVHMVLAAYLTTAFVVGAVGALHLLRDRTNRDARRMFSMAMWMAAIVAPIQIVAGDFHGLNTLEHQPVKVAAMEGHWERQTGAPLILFALPDEVAEENRYEIGIPGLSALILTHAWDGETPGLKDVPKDDRPPVAIVFWSFRIMVAIGMLMALVGAVSLYLRWRGTLYDARLFQRLALLMGPAGFIAVLAGWVTTEVGRQPYTVYGLLRTAESVAPIDAPAVAASLLAFIVVYFLLFGAGTLYILKMMNRAPADAGGEGPDKGKPQRAAGTTPAAALRPDAIPAD